MKTPIHNRPLIDRQHSFSPYPVFGYDRIGLYLDHADWPVPIQELETTCNYIKIAPANIPYQARWKQQIDIFQPTQATLRILDQALQGAVTVGINYAEIALDVLHPDKRRVKAIRNSFLAAAKFHYGRDVVIREESTYYYCRRTTGTNRTSKIPALYADKPSKLHNGRHYLDGLPCFHVEMRISRGDSLEKEGVVSLQDLILFKHRACWERNFRFYRIPTQPTKLGRILALAAGASSEVSGTALRARAKRWLARNSIKHGKSANFVLQNALLASPKVAQKLTRITFREWLDEELSQ